MRIIQTFLILTVSLLSVFPPSSSGREWIAYVGTYTRQAGNGIYALRFNSNTGGLTSIGWAGESSNPSFLAVHPNQRFLYSVGENSSGTVSAFSTDLRTGKLSLLNTVSSKGNSPCHIAFDRTGRWLFVANYGNGSIAALPVHRDGTLGEASAFIQHAGFPADPGRQKGPHAHSVNISRDNRFLVVTDLGLDQTLVYRFDSTTGTLTPNDPPFIKMAAGSGPRHFAFGAGGQFAYVLNEISVTVTALSYDKRGGSLTEIQTLSALPKESSGANSGAEIAAHPNGRFLYSSNRGPDSITVFAVDPKTGLLRAVDWVSTQGKTPRNFAIDPTGAFLLAANQNSNSIVVFRIDQRTGGLTETGRVGDIPFPVSLVFAKAH
ncbi:MAG: lactonase family protein [Acidobacteriota bacterium]